VIPAGAAPPDWDCSDPAAGVPAFPLAAGFAGEPQALNIIIAAAMTAMTEVFLNVNNLSWFSYIVVSPLILK